MESMITIVVPAYNVEDYIERCLRSLINQTYSNVTIMIINDGSTDKTREIAEKFSEDDKRIVVITQENRGLSAARNVGIINAKTKYLMFVDGDDYIELDSCERLLSEAQKDNCDIVCADGIEISDFSKEEMLKPRVGLHYPCTGIEFLVASIKQGLMSMCSVLALYKREFIINNRLFFEQGLLHEDELWTPLVYLKAQRVSHIDYCFYYHWYRQGSITNDKSILDKRAKSLIYICEKLFNEVESLSFAGKEYLLDRIAMLYLSAVYVGNYKQKKHRKFLFKIPCRGKNKIKALLYAVSPNLYLITPAIKGFLTA